MTKQPLLKRLLKTLFKARSKAMSKATLHDNDKENFAVILTGSFVCLVIIALFSIVTLIVSRGLAYFWVQPVHFVAISNSANTAVSTSPNTSVYFSNSETHFQFAMIQERDIHSDKIQRVRLHKSTYLPSGSGKPSVVAKQNITYLDNPPGLAKIGMIDGSFLLAIPRAIHTANTEKSPLDIDQYDDIYDEVSELLITSQDIQMQKLAELHQELATMRVRNVNKSAPAYLKSLQEYQQWEQELNRINIQLAQYQLSVSLADGQEIRLPLSETQYVQFPNSVNWLGKMQIFVSQVWRFVSESPKQAITAGGVFPALVGTVLMVMLMTVMVTPLGVLAAIYLAEYAPNNSVVSIIRIAVSNLAGVPSIVYGVFGLGFFVYTVGGQLDSFFFPDKSDVAVLGAPGLLWASLTMALLTLPVVIVATEEGLRRVPLALRQGSYALGATKFETLRLTVLPIATPGIMTGVILAIARGAGEVAPLLMLGAVKFALLLPVDGEFPFIHLERQFMHLGVLIYDGAFHSQGAGNEAGLMFAACMLLLVVVLVLNTIAVYVRNRLRNQYQVLIGN